MLDPLEVEDVFEDYECKEVIRIAENGAFEPAALVGGRRHDNLRRAQVFWLDERKDAGWVFDRLMGAVIEANRNHFRFDLSGFSERMQVAWYGSRDAGHFDWHSDIGDGALARRRKLTVVVQLSEEASYRGGDLEVNADGRPRAVTRKNGAAALFPSFLPHRVTTVTEGARYSLTTWVHGPDFR